MARLVRRSWRSLRRSSSVRGVSETDSRAEPASRAGAKVSEEKKGVQVVWAKQSYKPCETTVTTETTWVLLC